MQCDGTGPVPRSDGERSLIQFRADAAVAAVLVKLRGMTPEQAVAEVLRMKGAPMTSLREDRPIVERGLRDRAKADTYQADLLAQGIANGKRDLRRSFVFRFYHDTMTDTHLYGAYHKFGPESPDPVMEPITEPGWMGGQYRYVPWEFEYEGIKWRAKWEFGHGGGASPEFYVWAKIDTWDYAWQRRWMRKIAAALGRKEWRKVHGPRQVAEVLL